jgi:hypothetical protein
MMKFFRDLFPKIQSIDWERDCSKHRIHTTKYEDLCQ